MVAYKPGRDESFVEDFNRLRRVSLMMWHMNPGSNRDPTLSCPTERKKLEASRGYICYIQLSYCFVKVDLENLDSFNGSTGNGLFVEARECRWKDGDR